jgi:hypothetical protein
MVNFIERMRREAQEGPEGSGPRDRLRSKPSAATPALTPVFVRATLRCVSFRYATSPSVTVLARATKALKRVIVNAEVKLDQP